MKKTFGLLLFFCFLAAFPCNSVFASEGATGGPEKNKAFERTLKGQFPMTTDQIMKFKQRMKDTKRTLHRGDPPPLMNSRTRRLRFETGGVLPIVRIAPGYVTTISFFDCTGQPWPVTSVVLGNPNYYSVKRPEKQKNVITVSALKKYVDSNLALTFKGQDMPATIQLKTVSGEKETDSLVVFRADRRGPNAVEPTIGPEPEPTLDSVLVSFLDNVPPESAKRMRLMPGPMSGSYDPEKAENVKNIALWSYKDSLYLRTRDPLVWPAWNTIAKGPGGVRVYKLSKVPSLMLSRSGGSVVYEVGGAFNAR